MSNIKYKQTLYLGTVIFSLLALSLPFLVSAETVYREGRNIEVTDEQIVDGDFYARGNVNGSVVVSGDVNGDVYAFSQLNTVNSVVNGDVSLLGLFSQLHGSTSDDVRVAGYDVTIAGPVGGDVFVYAKNLTVLSTATISGDIFFFGLDATVNGKVGGSLYGEARSVRAGGNIDGNINMTVTDGLTLTDQATVSGDVRYTSVVPVSRAQSVIVEGEMIQNSALPPFTNPTLIGFLLLMFLFTTLVFLLLAKQKLQTFTAATVAQFGLKTVVGLGSFVGSVLLIGVLYEIDLGIWFAVVLGCALVFSTILSCALSGIMAGALLARLIGKDPTVNYWWSIIGSVTLIGFLFIPFVGPLVVGVIVCATFGSLVYQLYQHISE